MPMTYLNTGFDVACSSNHKYSYVELVLNPAENNGFHP